MDLAPLLGRTLVLVAHPDDEAVGCGALLQRIREACVIFATDAAPRDDFFWSRYGSREAYAEQRKREARQALDAVGIERFEFLDNDGADPIVDQELFLHLDRAADRLMRSARRFRPEAIVAPAYEGGHPDHDACSFLAALVRRQLQIPAWELPLYHRSTDGVMVRQQFLATSESEVLLDITAAELVRKRTMWAAYGSQGDVLDEFDPQVERLRPQLEYDYARPPHPGVLNYEAWRWRMSGSAVSAAFAGFLSARSPARHGPPSAA